MWSRQIFGGAKEFFPDSPKLARKLLQNKCPPKKTLHVNLGAIIFKSEHVGRHFCSDFQDVLEGSQIFCPDFMGFFPNFHQVKTFGGAVAPPNYTSAS